jgi:hypothetical protein
MKIKRVSFLFWWLMLLLSACTVSKQSVVPTPTLDTAHWKVYQDLNRHFSFEYPKSFDDRPLCALKVTQADAFSPTSTISMNNSDLKVMVDPQENPKDTDLQAVAAQLRGELGQLPQVSLDQPTQLTVAGTPALAQRYRTAYSKDGYLEYVFFIKDGIRYTIFLNTPATCDGYPGTPDADEAFQRILDSFQIQ